MEAKELAEAISNFVNSRGNCKELVLRLSIDHRTLQQSLFRDVIFPLIEINSEKVDSECDLRNEATVKACKVIAQSIESVWGTKRPPLPYI